MRMRSAAAARANGCSRCSTCRRTGTCTPLRGGRQHARRLACPAQPWRDVEQLNEGRDATERLSTEVAGGVSDLVDTDRTAELLLWVWQSLTGRNDTKQAQQQQAVPAEHQGVALFGAGCFRAVEAVFESLDGVLRVEPGFAGGASPSPPASYKEVHQGGNAGDHAEVVRITFDARVITFGALLDVLLALFLDPTSGLPDEAGAEESSRAYRPVIVCLTPEQSKAVAEAQAAGRVGPGVQVVQAHAALGTSTDSSAAESAEAAFHAAGEEHQRFFQRNPGLAYCSTNVVPKLLQLRERFPLLLLDRDAVLT